MSASASLWPYAGLAMLLALGGGVILSGLPVWALLLGVSSLFAALGMLGDVMSWQLLTALPSRVVGLLEHDLLQALPLYVLVGALLQRLKLADSIFLAMASLARFTGAGPALAALGVGALLAPMNGSVASSSALISRLIAPRVKHLGAARATALASVAATIGVVVPPSLVLILLGDAMMRAHTEASNLPGYAQIASLAGQRIINTQDVLHAALLPAACALALWLLVALVLCRGKSRDGKRIFKENKALAVLETAQSATYLIAISSVAGISALLIGVFTGRLLAVEAAAAGCCALILLAVMTQALSRAQWQAMLNDALAQSGALLGLLVGATTFSLVFRAFGTDRLISDMAMGSTLSPLMIALLILAFVALCAWVMDAFEMIFVVIPIVAPVLVLRLGDAAQASVLLLWVLQLGFLIPPMGYAVLMARSASLGEDGKTLGNWSVWRAIWPFVAVQAMLGALIFAYPAAVHQLDAPAAAQLAPSGSNAPSDADIARQMEEMAKQGEEATAKPVDAQPTPNLALVPGQPAAK